MIFHLEENFVVKINFTIFIISSNYAGRNKLSLFLANMCLVKHKFAQGTKCIMKNHFDFPADTETSNPSYLILCGGAVYFHDA
jgi:hypothetical protein